MRQYSRACKECTDPFSTSDFYQKYCHACRIPGQNVASVRKCIACESDYAPTSSRQKTCLTCTPDKSWVARYRRYGITKPEFDRRMHEQGGLCPLCLVPLELDHNTCVDHCHDSLLVRGILCRGCNMVVSRFEDPDYVARVREYLGEKVILHS